MQIQFGIVGVPNVTIYTSATATEVADYESREGNRKIERMCFDDARRRYANQGAEGTKYFMP